MSPFQRVRRTLLLSVVSLLSAAVSLIFTDQIVFRLVNELRAPLKESELTPLGERATFSTYHPILGYDGLPNIAQKFLGKLVTHNSRGNRGPEVDCSDKKLAPSIAISGDSQAWGYGVGDDDTIAAALKTKETARTGTAATVLNLGTSGYGPDQSLLKYLLYGRACRPKLVVFSLFVSNDFWEAVQTTAWGADKPRFFLHNNGLCLTNIPPPRARGWPYSDARSVVLAYVPSLDRDFTVGSFTLNLRDSQILKFLSRREFLLASSDAAGGPGLVRGAEPVREVFPCYEANPSSAEILAVDGVTLVSKILSRFDEIVRADGGTFRVLIIPGVTELETGTLNSNHSAIRNLLKSSSIPFTDLLDRQDLPHDLLLEPAPWVWAPDQHLSERASEIAAERIIRDAVRDGQL